MERISTMNEVKEPDFVLSERWDRMVYADNPDYRTYQWEYLGIPFLICYHVQSARYRVFMQGTMNRWDVTTALSQHALATAASDVAGHIKVCGEEW